MSASVCVYVWMCGCVGVCALSYIPGGWQGGLSRGILGGLSTEHQSELATEKKRKKKEFKEIN